MTDTSQAEINFPPVHSDSSASDDFDFTPDNLEAAGALTPSFDPGYQWPEETDVAANLEHWRDLKVGVIIHWGIYTTIGQGGSWSLHRDHLGDFTNPPTDFQGSHADYHRWYYQQRHRFNADDFDAADWARQCADAGMKYVVFTTKHHDGFALYDTAYSNLKVTAEDCLNGRDIFGEVTEAFRAAGLETGVYFSKADWSHPCYWDLARPLHDRFANYDVNENPRRWQRFVDYTHDQIDELLSNYGPMNVLWLDAGWVREPEESININQIAQIARSRQPGILVVDREVHGAHENYRTPEQGIPDTYLDYPWEACVTWTKSWCSMQPNEPCKPTREIISNLVRIVARGGNYLIGFGPDETGALSPYLRRGLAELGEWMRVNGEGIYGTRALAEPPIVTPKRATECGCNCANSEATPSYEWHAVTKDSRYFLYGIANSDHCEETAVEVALTVKQARLLGGGEVEITPAAGSGETSACKLNLRPNGQKWALVVELTC